jgi:hypothetical protein
MVKITKLIHFCMCFYEFFHPVFDSDPEPDPKPRVPDPDPTKNFPIHADPDPDPQHWYRILYILY